MVRNSVKALTTDRAQGCPDQTDRAEKDVFLPCANSQDWMCFFHLLIVKIEPTVLHKIMLTDFLDIF
nr:hypothetical protein Iba_chr14aCG6530 [Ipomoea batatas]